MAGRVTVLWVHRPVVAHGARTDARPEACRVGGGSPCAVAGGTPAPHGRDAHAGLTEKENTRARGKGREEERTGGDRRATQESAPEGRTTDERYHAAMAAGSARRRRLKRAGVALALGVATTLAVVGVLANAFVEPAFNGRTVIAGSYRVQQLSNGIFSIAFTYESDLGITHDFVSATSGFVAAKQPGRYRSIYGTQESEGNPIAPGRPMSDSLLASDGSLANEVKLGLPCRCFWTWTVQAGRPLTPVRWVGIGIRRSHLRHVHGTLLGLGREYGFPTGVLPVGFAVNTAVYGAAWYLLLAIPSARRKRRERRELCVACRYDRAGLAPDAACPECGEKPVAGMV